MTSERTPRREERLSTRFKDFYESLGRADQDRIDSLVQQILVDPAVDGQTIFDLAVPPIMWRVLVETEFTIYFRVSTLLGDNPVMRIQFDTVRRTLSSIRDMLRYPFYE